MPQIEAFESTDLPDVDVLLRPLIHTVCLIWANSRHYSTPGRIVVLLQEICNMFIQTVGSPELYCNMVMYLPDHDVLRLSYINFFQCVLNDIS